MEPGDKDNNNTSAPELDQAATMPDLIEKTLAPVDGLTGSSGAFMVAADGTMITVSPNAPEHLIGSIFDGKYEILSLLGQGGMSAVFKAKNLVLNRIVAIKILLGNRNLNEQSLMRFQQEARAASQLDHPNIVKVHDFSVSIDHAPYMVMDYVEGNSIAEIIAAEGKMDPYRAIDLIIQSCDALAHAHEQGVVHRDLKPSNIMVTQIKGGIELAKIVDFGVAKLMEEEQASAPQLTRTGEVFGSPLYMSPEQCLGKKVDARTDIYSLACVLFEELAGVPPFRADNVLATMHMHISDAPPELTKIRTDLQNGARLSSLLLTALAKNPEQRFPSMKEFANALNEAALKPQSGLFGSFATHLNIFRKTKGSNRNVPILVISATAFLLLMGTAWWGWQSQQALETFKNREIPSPPVAMSPRPAAGIAQKSLPEMPTDQQMTIYLKNNDPIELNIGNGINLTNAVAPLVSKEPKLRVLFMRSSSMDADGFKEITRSLGAQLDKLSISRNPQLKPKDIIEIFQNCTNLKHVAAQGVDTTDEVVASFGKFSSLQRLDISGKRTSSRALAGLPQMETVKHLMLNHTHADSKTIRIIAEKFPNLEELHMLGANLSSADLSPLYKLPLRNFWITADSISKKNLDKLQNAIGPGLHIHTEGYRNKQAQS